MRKSIVLGFTVLAIMTSFEACKHEPVYPANPTPSDSTATNPPGGDNDDTEDCDQSVVYFQNEVLPILVSNCTMSGCHNSASAQDGVVLDSYSSLMNSGVVEAFDAGDSDLIEAITETDPDKHMPPPPSTPLTSQQITLISNWINQGAQNTVCNTANCDTSSVTYSGTIKNIIQTNCQGCHSGSAPSGGYDFTTHGGLSGASSKLYGAVSHASGFVAMPKGGNKLKNCDIRKIKIWLDAGAPNN